MEWKVFWLREQFSSLAAAKAGRRIGLSHPCFLGGNSAQVCIGVFHVLHTSMINRRGFLGTLGASAVLSAVPALGSPSESSTSSSTSRKRISLNGEWGRYVGGSLWDVVT